MSEDTMLHWCRLAAQRPWLECKQFSTHHVQQGKLSGCRVGHRWLTDHCSQPMSHLGWTVPCSGWTIEDIQRGHHDTRHSATWDGSLRTSVWTGNSRWVSKLSRTRAQQLLGWPTMTKKQSLDVKHNQVRASQMNCSKPDSPSQQWGFLSVSGSRPTSDTKYLCSVLMRW